MNRLAFAFRFACLALCFALFTPSACVADTYFVSPSGKDTNSGTMSKPFLTLSQAVNSSSDTDTILVADGTYTGAKNRNVDFGGVDLNIQSISGNPANCVIDCQKQGCAFILQNNQTANSNIVGFTIKNGTGVHFSDGNAYGGGIYISPNDTNPVVKNCVFTGGVASGGGGMYYGTAVNCVFNGNTSNNVFSGGGGLYGGIVVR